METKTKKIDYNERLVKFANYIKGISEHPNRYQYGLVHLCLFTEDKNRSDINVRYPYWAFEELPCIFPEWRYCKETGIPTLPRLGYDDEMCSGIFDYFNLSPYEFIHLFDLDGRQDIIKYGGKELSFESGGEQIAENIYEFVKRKRSGFPIGFSLN